jgi:hypothetical protein
MGKFITRTDSKGHTTAKKGLADVDAAPDTVKSFRMRNLDDLTELVHCATQEVVIAITSGRPSLLNLYKPTGPMPAAEAARLVNVLRVIMETNMELREAAKNAYGHVNELHGKIREAAIKQRNMTSQFAGDVSAIAKMIEDYRPSISSDNHPEDE